MNLLLPSICLAAALVLAGAEPSAQVARATGVRASSAAPLASGVVHGGSYRRGDDRRRPEYTSASARVWVPGAFEIVTERVWIPGCRERIWIEPVFELRTSLCGLQVRVEVRPGHHAWVERPGHHELRRSRVWRPGHWSVRGGC